MNGFLENLKEDIKYSTRNFIRAIRLDTLYFFHRVYCRFVRRTPDSMEYSYCLKSDPDFWANGFCAAICTDDNKKLIHFDSGDDTKSFSVKIEDICHILITAR